MGVVGIVCVFLAVQKVSLINVTLLSNTAPLFVPLLGWLFLKKPIDHRGWPAIALGFLGVMLILNPTKDLFDPWALYALGNGLTTAATFLVVRMATKTEQMHTLLFYYYLIGFLLFLPVNIFTFTMPDLITFLELVLMGAFAYWGSALSFHALKYGKAAQLAPFSYIGVVYTGIIQWILWGQVPSLINTIGICLTCAAGVYILLVSKPSADNPKLKF
jgi:drug/metabolite transporter (DMT)-like permease